MAGGGGLIQLPALFAAYPATPHPTLLGTGNDGGVLVVQSTGAVRVECSGVLDARGTTLVLVLDANLLTGSLSLTNLSATTAVSVRFCIGAAR